MDRRVACNEDLTVRKCGDDDWFVIEKAKHDGHVWLEPAPDGRSASLMTSARITNADVEGTAAEMLEIAEAIETGGRARAIRCSAETDGGYVLLESPRNSMYSARVPMVRARELAQKIRTVVGGPVGPGGD